jgi:hypothetical protein
MKEVVHLQGEFSHRNGWNTTCVAARIDFETISQLTRRCSRRAARTCMADSKTIATPRAAERETFGVKEPL